MTKQTLCLLMPCSLAELVDHHAELAHTKLAASSPKPATDAERAAVSRILEESAIDFALYGHLIPGGTRRAA